MKKVCMITTVSLTLKVFVVETAKYLHKQCGYDVTLICDNDEEFKISLPNYIHYIPVHNYDMNYIFSFFHLNNIFLEQFYPGFHHE